MDVCWVVKTVSAEVFSSLAGFAQLSWESDRYYSLWQIFSLPEEGKSEVCMSDAKSVNNELVSLWYLKGNWNIHR